MPSLAEIRFSIRNQLVGLVANDDSRLRYAFIDKIIRDKRSKLIQSAANRGLGVDSMYYQQIDCLEIKCDEVKCAGVSLGVKYDHVTIPVVESFRGSIAWLGTLDGKVQFGELSLSGFLNIQKNRFGKGKPCFTVIGTTALIKYAPSGLSRLQMHAVLEDPLRDLCKITNVDSPYPVPNSAVHDIEVMCLKQLMSTLSIPADMTNDAEDSGAVQVRTNPNQIDQ